MKKMTNKQLANLKQNHGKPLDTLGGFQDMPKKVRTKPKRRLTSSQLANLKQFRNTPIEQIKGHPKMTKEEKGHDYTDTVRNCSYKRNYNITIEDWNAMFESQNGKCAICGRHQSEFKRKLDTDHNHVTGKVRGLLCHSCNLKIGYYETSAVWFNKNRNKIENYLDRQSKLFDFSI